MKKCGFQDCGEEIPEDDMVCETCCWKLHVELCRLWGITDRRQVQIEWERQTENQSSN